MILTSFDRCCCLWSRMRWSYQFLLVLVAVGILVSLVYIGLVLLPVYYERFLPSPLLLMMKWHASILYIRLGWCYLLIGIVLAGSDSLIESILLSYSWYLTSLDMLHHYQLVILCYMNRNGWRPMDKLLHNPLTANILLWCILLVMLTCTLFHLILLT